MNAPKSSAIEAAAGAARVPRPEYLQVARLLADNATLNEARACVLAGISHSGWSRFRRAKFGADRIDRVALRAWLAEHDPVPERGEAAESQTPAERVRAIVADYRRLLAEVEKQRADLDFQQKRLTAKLEAAAEYLAAIRVAAAKGGAA